MEAAIDVRPRTYLIRRNQHLGYGFVAGSEAPTIVKSVEPNGPSYSRLLQGDLIMAVNGINVEDAPREQIINMIIKCQDQIEITVRQPAYEDLTRAKITKMHPIKPPAKVMEILEVVIMIFFEDGRTRKLTYNQDTTVGMILDALNERQTGSSPYSEEIKNYFGLVLTCGVSSEGSPKDQLPKRKQLHVLAENDPIMGLRHLPYWRRLRFLYRMVHPPADVTRLYTQDKVAFEYLYQQSCNDLKLERFDPELDQDIAFKLIALHLLEYVYSNSKAHGNSKDPKVYTRLVEKSPGIEYFLPISIAETAIDKKGKKIVGQYKKLRNRLTSQLKKNFEEFDFEPSQNKSSKNVNRYSSSSFHDLSSPEIQNSPSDYTKLIFLKCLSQQPCYGNSKRPIRASVSPAGRNSVGECSSSLDSVASTKSTRDYNSIEKLYSQRYTFNDKPIEELLRKAVLRPPPLPPTSIFDDVFRQVSHDCGDFTQMNHFTQILTERDIEKLKVPPPPRMFN